MDKVLIVDDSLFNGELLEEILKQRFEVIYVDSGRKGVEYIREHINELTLLLLDIVMPDMDGFDVLSIMNYNGWINKLPVIMISSESSSSYINHAFQLGAIEYRSRPFEPDDGFRRIDKTLDAFRNKPVEAEVKDQDQDMIEMLSSVVEFRNGETGVHLFRLKVITSILLNRYKYLDKKCDYSPEFIEMVANASVLHDVGKISIPYEILHKPGRLTKEEFEIIKGHSLYGANMIKQAPNFENSELLKLAYEIARWHHEKIDGAGYPDGITDIPIYVQAVSLADCYDALTSERCYKKAFTPEESLQMLANGECGKFSELMIKCLNDSKEELISLLDLSSPSIDVNRDYDEFIGDNIVDNNDIFTRKIKTRLDIDRQKNKYLYDGAAQCVFEYSSLTQNLTFARLNFENYSNYPEWVLKSLKNQLIDFLNNYNGEQKSITLTSLDERTCNIFVKVFDSVNEKIYVGKITA